MQEAGTVPSKGFYLMRIIKSAGAAIVAVLFAGGCVMTEPEIVHGKGEAGASVRTIMVPPAETDRSMIPVEIPVSDEIAAAGYRALRDMRTQSVVPLQFLSVENGPVLVFILPRQRAGEMMKFRLVPDAVGAEHVETTREGDTIRVDIGDRHLTTYHFAGDLKKPFLYPLTGPEGVPMTRGYPMEDIPGESRDHPHHRSFYTAYGDVNGVDCWSEGGNSGQQRTDEILTLESGPVLGRIRARNTWLSKEGEKVLTEEREYRFYNTPEDVRLFDLTVTFIASDGEVRFGDTKEGGIAAVRVHPDIKGKAKGMMRNSRGGVAEKGCWGKRAEWCDYSGPIGDVTCGIAIFDHPGNLRHPTWWHARDYGLMTANCFGLSYFEKGKGERGDYVLPAGDSLTFHYRMVLHRGEPAAAGLDALYAEYTDPPAVSME
jgi:hypothetical protein